MSPVPKILLESLDFILMLWVVFENFSRANLREDFVVMDSFEFLEPGSELSELFVEALVGDSAVFGEPVVKCLSCIPLSNVYLRFFDLSCLESLFDSNWKFPGKLFLESDELSMCETKQNKIGDWPNATQLQKRRNFFTNLDFRLKISFY
jgi:hypothetical protein